MRKTRTSQDDVRNAVMRDLCYEHLYGATVRQIALSVRYTMPQVAKAIRSLRDDGMVVVKEKGNGSRPDLYAASMKGLKRWSKN
jgi:DNA-binding MarR family transcriptional regulator